MAAERDADLPAGTLLVGLRTPDNDFRSVGIESHVGNLEGDQLRPPEPSREPEGEERSITHPDQRVGQAREDLPELPGQERSALVGGDAERAPDPLEHFLNGRVAPWRRVPRRAMDLGDRREGARDGRYLLSRRCSRREVE